MKTINQAVIVPLSALEAARCAKINFENVLGMMSPLMAMQMREHPMWMIAMRQLDEAIALLAAPIAEIDQPEFTP